jgi:hypothetical protein
MFMMMNEMVSQPSVVSDDLVQIVCQKSVKDLTSEFYDFLVNFLKFHTLFSMK